MRILRPLSRSLGLGALAWLLVLAGGSLASMPATQAQPAQADGAPAESSTAGAPIGAVELSQAPVNLVQAVAPNIVVTFDDSGSMADDFMGDTPPFGTNKSWGSGPWYCAGVIDPRITDTTQLASSAMNGVYYNPNVIYLPPVKADGTSMPNADSTLAAVWNDGVTANRPRSASGSGTTTSFVGVKSTGRNGRDNRWTCPSDSTSPLSGNNGGPYYYRLKSGVSIGMASSPNTSNLYNAANWEAVAVATDGTQLVINGSPVTVNGASWSQAQNWANWWAYYHTRNLMARTSISRVFGAIANTTKEGGYGSDIRAVWQNLDSNDYQLPGTAIITSLIDGAGCSAANVDPKSIQTSGALTTSPACYRSAFFNWIFNVGNSGGTPSRSATIRAGEFFKRGHGNTGANGNLTDPYWQPGENGAQGNELVCRQNFHMLVTDGMWNDSKKNAGDETLTGGWSDKASGLVAPIPQTSTTLPDGQAYDPASAVAKIFGGPHDQGGGPSLADIAFHYWATNLRDDLYNPSVGKVVAPYMPDTTTGVTAAANADDGGKSEIYFNPANDPANWPHLVQYLVGLGVNGTLAYSTDIDCTANPASDLCKLRKGQLSWPQPNGTQGNGSSQGTITNIDDTWHAALEGRGQFFSAGNPQNLVDQLTKILTGITARSAQPQTSALNTSVLTQGALSFSTGYSSSDWSGVFQAVSVDANGNLVSNGLQWDAGQILNKADPGGRQILTSIENGDGHFNQGIAFRNFADLDGNSATSGSSYQSAQSLLLDAPPSTNNSDTGQARVDYLRGTRTLEGSVMRSRSSLLGAIINSQAVYLTYPDSGYLNTWPDNSPEALAAAQGQTYEQFVQDHLNRKPTVYVGANDGMLHAFDASMATDNATGLPVHTATSGQEEFAYVPRAVFANLGNLTSKSDFAFAPTEDGTPVTRDVYFGSDANNSTHGWHTILVSGLRGGGRGVFALDVTDPAQVTEANAASKVLWEFTADTPTSNSDNPANLGYTYGQPNIGRLANGKWVVLVPGGYFPDCSKPDKPVDCTDLPGAHNAYSSLFVLDAQSGALIKELRTPTNITGVTSAGLSSPVLGDYEGDQIDDVAFAGDVNGNLWRFDLTGTDPTSWTITLAYKPDTEGEQPITSMPRLFPDAGTGRFVVIFGTGKYLGAGDSTSTGAPTQSVYGIRDPGAAGKTVAHSDLLAQNLSEVTIGSTGGLARTLTDNQFQADGPQGGWYIDLDLGDAKGERVVVTPAALFDSNRVIITTLIPGTSDPCSASIQGALMVVDAVTGGSGGGISNPVGSNVPAGYKVVGTLVNNPPTSGTLPVASAYGGGKILAPGLSGAPSIDSPIWRRRAWRILDND